MSAGYTVTLSYTPNTKEMRVIIEPTENTDLPLTNEGYTAPATKADATVTQIGQWYGDQTYVNERFYPREGIYNTIGTKKDFATGNYTSGMGYVIRLEDGSFIVVDGGYDTETHVDNLYNVLFEQSEGKGIVIAAWVFTHAHNDHADAFKIFTNKYAPDVTIESFIFNFPANEAAEAGDVSAPNLDQLYAAMDAYGNAKRIVARAGQIHTVRNAKINVLFTYDMMLPYTLVDYNVCSVVFNVEIEGSKILFLGDAGGETDVARGTLSYMLDIYTSTTLGADIVQVAHHGIDAENSKGTVADFYEAVGADYAFIPVADNYIKIGEDLFWIDERAAYTAIKNTATIYLAADDVVVLIIKNGGVSGKTYVDVSAYVNS